MRELVMGESVANVIHTSSAPTSCKLRVQYEVCERDTVVFLYPLRRSNAKTDKEKRSEKGHASTSVGRVVRKWRIEFNSRIELGFSEEIIYGRPTSASHCFLPLDRFLAVLLKVFVRF